MSRRLLFCLLVVPLVLLNACQAQPLSLRPTERTASLGEPFALSWGESITLTDAGLIVTLESIADSRCPTHDECGDAGTVEAVLHVGQDAGRAKALVVSAYTDETGQVLEDLASAENRQTYAGFTYILKDVAPYPDADAPPSETAYRVTLVVTESGS